MNFNRANGNFTLSYLQNPAIQAPTEIYLNEDFYYSNGYTVTLSPSDAATWKATSKNHIQVSATSSTSSKLLVTITPK